MVNNMNAPKTNSKTFIFLFLLLSKMTKRKTARRRGSQRRASLKKKSAKYSGNVTPAGFNVTPATSAVRCTSNQQCPDGTFCLYHSHGVYFCEPPREYDEYDENTRFGPNGDD